MKKDLIELCRRLKFNVVSGKGLSNRIINSFCKAACGPDFKGAFASDCIPIVISKEVNFIIIVNLGLRNRGKLLNGKLEVGHFVTIIGQPNAIHYIDPYGQQPPGAGLRPELNAFLRSCNRPLRVSRKQVQHDESSLCGLYCILFACYADGRGGKMQLRFYRVNMKRNDELCSTYLKRIVSPAYSIHFRHQKRRYPFL